MAHMAQVIQLRREEDEEKHIHKFEAEKPDKTNVESKTTFREKMRCTCGLSFFATTTFLG